MILPSASVPTSLWSDDTLRLPQSLADSYESEIDRLDLRNVSISVVHKQIHGGKSDDETLEHFALRFAASAGRVEFATLGVSAPFATLSDAVLVTFSDGRVAVLDIPCGTGAATAALISTLVELRKQSILPRLPLTVSVCAGDYSPKALEIFHTLMSKVLPVAAEEGITLTWIARLWDATRTDHAADLMDQWFATTGSATEHIVMVTNFSGALHNQGTFDQFSPSLEHILARLHNKRGTLIWIEPATKSATRGVLTRVWRFLTARVPWFVSTAAENETPLREAHYNMKNPVSTTVFRSNVAIVRFDRV